jgi:hypothetical protein
LAILPATRSFFDINRAGVERQDTMDNPLFPDSREIEDQLIAGLRAHPRRYKELTEWEQKIIRNAQPVPCPICGRLYDFYNRRQCELQYFCSRACKDAAQVKYKMQCPVPGCGVRVKNRQGLERHRQNAHHDIPLAQFVDILLERSGECPLKYCAGCGRNLEPSVLYWGYKPCRCVFCERKIARLDRLIAECTDSVEKTKLKRQRAGTISALKRMRGIKRLTKKQTAKKGRQKRQLNLLEKDAEFFRGLMDTVAPVYAAYDDLARAIQDRTQRAEELNERLICRAKQFGFKLDRGVDNGAYLYVAACDPLTLASPTPSAQFYVLRINYSVKAYADALADSGIKPKELEQLEHRISEICRTDRAELQFQHRFLIHEPDGPRYRISPLAIVNMSRGQPKKAGSSAALSLPVASGVTTST